jgi:hypothetical protein
VSRRDSSLSIGHGWLRRLLDALLLRTRSDAVILSRLICFNLSVAVSMLVVMKQCYHQTNDGPCNSLDRPPRFHVRWIQGRFRSYFMLSFYQFDHIVFKLLDYMMRE